MACWGLTYAMPVIFPTLSHEFEAPAWHFAAYFSIGGAIYFSIGGYAGALADRHGAPAVVWAGLCAAATALLLASFSHSEWLFAICYIAAIGAAVGLTYAPVTAAVQVLSVHRKMLTAGITSSGIGFGSMLFPPLAAWLMHIADWRVALQVMAAIIVIGGLPVLALRGSLKRAPPPTGVSALRTNRNFAWAFVGQILFAVMFFVPFAHLVNVSLALGWSVNEGVELISLLGLGSTIGRFLAAPFAQRLGACRGAAVCALVTAIAMLGLALGSSHVVLWFCAAVFGVSYGAVIALSAPIVTEICGAADTGRNVGVLMGARAIGVLLGPWSVGLAQWMLGAYTLPLAACALVGLAAAACMARSGIALRAAADAPSSLAPLLRRSEA
jgi:MFS family permease